MLIDLVSKLSGFIIFFSTPFFSSTFQLTLLKIRGVNDCTPLDVNETSDDTEVFVRVFFDLFVISGGLSTVITSDSTGGLHVSYRADYSNRPSNSISFMTVVPKQTFFCHIQELIMNNTTRTISVSVTLFSTPRSNLKTKISSHILSSLSLGICPLPPVHLVCERLSPPVLVLSLRSRRCFSCKISSYIEP